MYRSHSYATQSAYKHKLAHVAMMDFTKICSPIDNNIISVSIIYQLYQLWLILKEERIGVVWICPIYYIPLIYTILDLANFLKGWKSCHNNSKYEYYKLVQWGGPSRCQFACNAEYDLTSLFPPHSESHHSNLCRSGELHDGSFSGPALPGCRNSAHHLYLDPRQSRDSVPHQSH